MHKAEIHPFILPSNSPKRQTISRWSFFLGLAFCFILLTGSWHVFGGFSRSRVPNGPWPSCIARDWITKHDSRTISGAKGVSVIHRREGKSGHVNTRGHVLLEGTDKEDIQVIIEWKTTSKVMSEGNSVSLQNGNDVIITTAESGGGYLDCLELDVTVQIPSSTPFVNLDFLYSSLEISNSLTSDITNLVMSTKAGSISSNATHLNTKSASIETHAGSIDGHFILGETLSLTSSAGEIDVEIEVNTILKSPEAKLETKSRAGSVAVNLISPLKHRNRISAVHETAAGNVKVRYPQEWEGAVTASTAAGLLTLKGEGLEIVEKKGGFGNEYEKAVKGEDWEEKGTVNVVSAAGNVLFVL